MTSAPRVCCNACVPALHVCCKSKWPAQSISTALLCSEPCPCTLETYGRLGTRMPAPEALRARLCGCQLVERGRPGLCGCGLRATNALSARAQLLYAEHTAHMLTGRVGRQGGGGGAYPQSGEGGHGPGDGLAHRRELMRCEGRICWANAELCAQCAGCLCKAVQGSRGCGACWTGERLRRAVHGLVGRELRCDVRCGLWRASAGCRGGGLRASCAMRLRNSTNQPTNPHPPHPPARPPWSCAWSCARPARARPLARARLDLVDRAGLNGADGGFGGAAVDDDDEQSQLSCQSGARQHAVSSSARRGRDAGAGARGR